MTGLYIVLDWSVLPVLTWYLRVSLQSTSSWSRFRGSSGIPKSMTSFSCSGCKIALIVFVQEDQQQTQTYRVEVQDLDCPVVLDGDVVQEYLHHPLEELPSLGVRLARVSRLTDRPKLWKKSVSNAGNITRDGP